MQIFIPSVGDKIKLKNDIDLNLKYKSQNNSFIKKIKEMNANVKSIDKDFYPLALKKGTILIIDRVYVRSGDSSAFNSITFKVNGSDYLPNGRFFVSLDVANNMGAELIEDDNEIKSIKLREYLSSEIIKNNRKMHYFEAVLESKTKCLRKISIKLNAEKTIKSLEKAINKTFMQYFNVSYDSAYENVIECLKIDTSNINKETATKAKLNLQRAIELKNSEEIQHLLSEKESDENIIDYSEILLNKVVPCKESIEINNPFLIEFNFVISSHAAHTLSWLEYYIKLAEYIFLEYGKYNNFDKWEHAYGAFQFDRFTDVISDNPKINSFMSQYGKSYNGSYRTRGSGQEETKERLYIPYENLRYFKALSVNGFGSEDSNFCLEYYDGDKKISLSKARSLLTNAKKKS